MDSIVRQATEGGLRALERAERHARILGRRIRRTDWGRVSSAGPRPARASRRDQPEVVAAMAAAAGSVLVTLILLVAAM